MISDDFETFIDDNFWRGQTKNKLLVQKIIHFIKIQNIQSKKYPFFKNLEQMGDCQRQNDQP